MGSCILSDLIAQIKNIQLAWNSAIKEVEKMKVTDNKVTTCNRPTNEG